MAVDNTYPSDLLPDLIRDNARQTVERFRNADVFRGPSFTEIYTRDTPSTMQRSLFVTRGQANVFEIWLNQSTTEQLAPRDGGFFLIDVLTPYGMQTQECRFLSTPQPTGALNSHISYSFTLYIREFNNGIDISDGSSDAQDILDLAEISPKKDPIQGMNLLDEAVNEDWP